MNKMQIKNSRYKQSHIVFMVFFCAPNMQGYRQKRQIAFLDSPDIAAHKITSEMPWERENNFLTSAKK